MAHPLLRGPALKVERAYTHINEIAAEINAFAQDNPYRIVYEPNEAEGQQVVRARLTKNLPDIVDVYIGETLYNLRSALDQLTCALATLNGCTNFDDVQFPISRSEEVFVRPRTQEKIRKLSDRAQDMIRGLKPYRGGNEALWILNELCNIDKHRKLIAMGSRLGDITITGGTYGGGFTIGGGPSWTSFEEGIELFRVGITDNPNNHGRIEVALNIAFGEVDEISHVPVISVLSRLVHVVDQVIVHFDSTLFASSQ